MTDPLKATAHDALVRDSWNRCRAFGLTHASAPQFDRLAAGDLAELLERRRALLATTEGEVLPYYENILANSRCLIRLADAEGRLLHGWGDRRFVEPTQAAGFEAGASWRERDLGTNAIGTVLAGGEAVHIQRDEHFLTANRFMAGAAAPLYDAARRVIGVLDVCSDSYLPPSHVLGMVRVMSQAVESRLIGNLFRDSGFQLAFGTSADALDGPWTGLLVFDEAGRVLAANRRADSLLGATLVGRELRELFDLSLGELLDRPDTQPFVLRAAGRSRLHARLTRPRRVCAGQVSPAASATPAIPATPAPTFSRGTALGLAQLDLGDPRVGKAVRQAERLYARGLAVLIQGETGVGKEVLVKALHQAGERATRPLVAVNCAAIPAELIEAELFGYEKGAFTGASPRGSLGLIRKADGGTLFLDEIGDMPAAVQARLLRVLQERQVQPLGGGEPQPIDIRLISATHRNLREEVAAGRFREDLYYRVAAAPVTLPPLRERLDRGALFRQMLLLHRDARQPDRLGAEVLALFERHPWPGNLRQLASVVQVALAMADDGPIGPQHLPDDFFVDLQPHAPRSGATPAVAPVTDLVRLAGDLPAQLAACGGNLSHLARQLGVSRNTLYKRLREHGLDR